LKLRSGLSNVLYIRDCYKAIIDDIVISLPVKVCKTFAILGTAGIGKSSLFLFVLKCLLDDPDIFGLKTRSFYFQTTVDDVWFYKHHRMDEFRVRVMKRGEPLDDTIPLFADMETMIGSPKVHGGFSLIFTSFRPERYKELFKNGWRKMLPTWSDDEQAEFFNSVNFRNEYGEQIAQRALDNIMYFGGSIRSNIQVAIEAETKPDGLIEDAVTEKGKGICEIVFSTGFGGLETEVSDVLVHRNPSKNFNAVDCSYSFASNYICHRLFALYNDIVANSARERYRTGTCRGSDDGKLFEQLCLHCFKISNKQFLAQPLTINAQKTQVVFPQKQLLAPNWREKVDYLKADVLYIPSYGNLESGDAFCLIQLNGKPTLVILQITIADKHPVKQNGVRIIHQCYTKNSHLKVRDTVIMFMIPVNGRLKTKQNLVTTIMSKKVQRLTVEVTAQFIIENELLDERL
jgi:hypothetical protein